MFCLIVLFYLCYFSENKPSGKVTGKEHLVFTDQESTLYHFVIEGSTITDVSKLPVEVS